MRIDFFENWFGRLLEDGKTQNHWEDGEGSSLEPHKKDFIREGGIVPKKKGSYIVKLFAGSEDAGVIPGSEEVGIIPNTHRYPKIKTIKVMAISCHGGESELDRLIRDMRATGEFPVDTLIKQLNEIGIYVKES